MAKNSPLQNDTHSEVEKISNAAAEALKLVARETAEAAKVLASSAAEALKITSVRNSEDHDLLIGLKGQMDRLSIDIKDLKEGTSRRISDLEDDKADKREFEELKKDIYGSREKRIRSLESKVANYFITLSIYTVAVGGTIWIVVSHILKGQ